LKKTRRRRKSKEKIIMRHNDASFDKEPEGSVMFYFNEGDLVTPRRNVSAACANTGYSKVIPRNAMCMVAERPAPASIPRLQGLLRNRPLPRRKVCVMYEGQLLLVTAKVLRFIEES